MSNYLDASALVSLWLKDTHAPRLIAWGAAAARPLIVSDFATAGLASVVARQVRTRALTEAEATALLRRAEAWSVGRVTLAPGDVARATTMVERFDLGLRAPDALHLALVERLGLPLVTFDVTQARAARALGLVVADL